MNAKISIFTIFACFALLFAGCSKDNENIPGGIEPPNLIIDSFKVKYPGAQGTEWQVAGDYYVADFRLDSTEVAAWFVPTTGQWVMDKADLRITLIPDEIVNALQEGVYAGWTIEEAYVINRAGFGTIYKVEVEKGVQDIDLYVSQYGNLIKVVEDTGNNTDEPIIIPAQVASLMELTFAGSELLYMEPNSQGYVLYLLDGTVFKIAQLNSSYLWQSTTWKLSEQDVPTGVMQAFENSAYANDPVSSIYTLLNANGTFFLFNVIHNGQFTTVKFDAIGNIVTGA